MEKINPFGDSGIINIEQFKKYPFLFFGVQKWMDTHIKQKTYQITQKLSSGDRFILIGDKGGGKTSTLFFIKEQLEKQNFKVFYLTRLINDFEHFELMTLEKINEVFNEPMYILIDFPDTIEPSTYKKFLLFLWELITNRNQENINLIFSMNHTHFNKSFSYSEIFGKFIKFQFDRWDEEETRKLMESRLNLVNKKLEDIMTEEAFLETYNNTKGIPRNIISAGFILYQEYNGKPIGKTKSNKIYKEKLNLQIINDRVKDQCQRREFTQIIEIIQNDFDGIVSHREKLNEMINDKLGIGRTTIIKRLESLERFGIIVIRRGGYNRVNKIISFV